MNLFVVVKFVLGTTRPKLRPYTNTHTHTHIHTCRNKHTTRRVCELVLLLGGKRLERLFSLIPLSPCTFVLCSGRVATRSGSSDFRIVNLHL